MSFSPTALNFTTNIANAVFQIYIVDAVSGLGTLIGTPAQSTNFPSLPPELPTVDACRVCVGLCLSDNQFIQLTAFPNTTVYWPSGAAPTYVCQVQLSGTTLALDVSGADAYI